MTFNPEAIEKKIVNSTTKKIVNSKTKQRPFK